MKKAIFTVVLVSVFLMAGCKKDAVPELELDVPSLSFDQEGAPSSGGTATFSITSNVDWTIESSDPWCVPQLLKGNGDAPVKVNVNANPLFEARTATITVSSVDGGIKASLSVRQEKNLYRVEIQSGRLEFDASGTAIDKAYFSFEANAPWKLESNQTWCKPGKTQGDQPETITVTVNKNLSEEPREAKLTLTVGDQTAVVTIYQKENTTENYFSYITDPSFKSYCAPFDLNKNGILSLTEIEQVTRIDVSDMKVRSMSGIEFFTNLVYLDCGTNNIDIFNPEMDNQILTLDVSRLEKLTVLKCRNAGLTSLNTSGCRQLQELDVAMNSLSKLDLSDHSKLELLNCKNNLLTSLDVTKNPLLKELIGGDQY